MMAENDKILEIHVAEDDDTQKLRAWWKKNGMGMVAGVAIGVAGVGGFKGWQVYTENRALSASDVFQEMLAYDESGAVEQAQDRAQMLAKDYRSTPYVDMAYLMIAKLAIKNNELSNAMEALTHVMTKSNDPAMRQLARLRLARVTLLAGDLVRAQELVTTDDVGGFESEYPEVLGDILVAQHKYSDAAEAYDRALQALAPASSSRALLTSKRNYAGSIGSNQ
ncbi:MAG TPA: tetratricopeptide repeat protein [Gammaproteobacteria bacterium]|nr:tetratricopeptide repeat protein [Gammaproteobacteria bacterium]HIC21738.1 tetratricopeptide repeat protein [Gammaproteobacteria bacterium]